MFFNFMGSPQFNWDRLSTIFFFSTGPHDPTHEEKPKIKNNSKNEGNPKNEDDPKTVVV